MMNEIIEILKHDFNMIKKTPMLVIFLAGIIFIPSLYVLVNVDASWDIYNETSNIKVAVVNNDLGYTTNGSQHNFGNSIVDALRNNTKFSWQFVDQETAMDGVKNGTYYTAIIIPGNFSEDLLSIETSNPHQAQIEYVTNEKLNPVATRLVGTVGDLIEAKINDEVVKTVDGIIFGKLADVGELASENEAQFLKTRSLVNEMNNNVGSIDSSITEANSDLSTVTAAWSQIKSELPEMKSNADYAENEYNTLYSYVSGDPSKAVTTVQGMKTKVSTLITNLQYMEALLTTLYQITGDENLKPIITEVGGDITDANNTLTTLNGVESDLQSTGTTNRLNSLKTSIDQTDSAVNTLYNNQDQINQKINTATTTLNLVNSKWPTFKNTIQDAANKLNQVSNSDLNNLTALSNIDPDAAENYFESPVKLDKESVYPINNYGSAVAPFYMGLSLWIGCLIAVALLAVQVRSKKKYGAKAAYFGRMGLFLVISIFQALLIVLAALFLSVQNSSVSLLILTTLVVGVCFMVIMYSLVSLFGSPGKAIAMILLVLQIAAGGGIYPIQIQPNFFQSINPYLPMTYGIGAIREVVGGVLWSSYWYNLVMVLIFAAAALIISLLMKRGEQKISILDEKLRETGLI